jgi:hypothetical protein
VPIQQEVTFAPESDLPAIHARVDVLLLLARAVRLHFPEFVNAQDANGPPAPYEVLRILADILADQMARLTITDITHALDVWASFTADPAVKKLPGPSSRLIRTMGQRVAADANTANAGMGRNIIWAANLQAQRWIVDRFLPQVSGIRFAPAPVVIDYDESGRQFCASSSPLRGEIHWTLQPLRHSLFGAMVMPHILEHEYVSHLIPRNQNLSKGVREVFLVETLEEEHRNDINQDARNRNAEIKLDGWFRYLLEAHSCHLGQSNRAELRDFQGVATRMRLKSKSDFWKMTGEILYLPKEGDAELVNLVIRALSGCTDEEAGRLAIPWRGFQECWATVR